MADVVTDAELQLMLEVIAERPRDRRLAVVYRAAGRALLARGTALDGERTTTPSDQPDGHHRRPVDPSTDPRHHGHPDQHPA